VRDELNVKEVIAVADRGELVRWQVRPNYRSLGPRFGPRAKAVADRAGALTPEEITTFRETGALRLMVDGEAADISGNDLEAAEVPREGLVASRDASDVVALDVRLDEALVLEGRARELVHRIQTMRKSAGMKVTDRIRLYCDLPAAQAAAVKAHESYVAGETLAASLSYEYRKGHYEESFALEGETVRISLTPASGGEDASGSVGDAVP
jgi:isoleucyl-tRNA synthetase